MSKTINVASDFSRFPAGRKSTDGKFSGETFRKKFLEPSLQANEQIRVELDGTYGYGSSFLEEAFGGLIRSLKIDASDVISNIELITDDPSLKQEIIEYIRNA